MTDQNTPPAAPPAKKGTLSLGGTLSVGSSGSSRPGGVSVEVRRRRFDGPTATPAPTSSAPTLPKPLPTPIVAAPIQAPAPKAAPKAKAAEPAAAPVAETTPTAPAAAQPAPVLSAREEALRKAGDLQSLNIKAAQERASKEAAEREAQKAERERLAALAQSRAGSGGGGVQSGTLNSSGPARNVDSRAFTKTTISLDDARRRSSSGRPELKDSTAKRGRNAYLSDLADRARTSGGGKRRRGDRSEAPEATAPAEKISREVLIPEFITVAELAARMSEKAADVVKKLMLMGEMVTANQTIDQGTAEVIVTEMGHKPKLQQAVNLEDLLRDAPDAPEALVTRAPIVTIMGHVDHGKTTLLDTLRKANVAKGEAGGITQHIGAYQVKAPSGRLITFLDTPGHAAFTAMRARGAQVTDVVILVVAADDGVMPQTAEAIQHARAAGVPLVVALNKIDKPTANPAKVKNELLGYDVVLEEFGGNVPCVPVSGLTGQGLGELEEIVLLQADVLDLKANPNRRAEGTVVEARLDKGRGPVATVVVQTGTLKTGDIVVAGPVWGRVRALVNDRGQTIKEAGPSMPVELLGLAGVPAAGDTFIVAADEKTAKDVAAQRDIREREKAQAARKLTLEGLMEKLTDAGEGVKELNLIVKADVQGSVEAIQYALTQLNADQTSVKVKVVSGGVGVMTETDVNLAIAAGALIVGFNVRADATAREVAERNGIELRYYTIIYQLIDDIKAAMSGLLAPNVIEEVTGQAEIRALFTYEKLRIAGCMVTSGKIGRGSKVRLLRDGQVVHTGELATLKRGKDDAKDVASGFECGMTFLNFTDFKEKDVVEAFVLKEVKRTIDDLKQAAGKA
ncbi:MAG: translation initiation factor IF-2 [Alphaproteobacteria bacterium]|nr:translation initiation factor IF-2 [Alphaproteobacteria bacterium]